MSAGLWRRVGLWRRRTRIRLTEEREAVNYLAGNGLRKERLRKNKSKALIARERKLSFTFESTRHEENYSGTNFPAEGDHIFDDAQTNKAEVTKLEREKYLRNKMRKGGGEFWTRQTEGDGLGFGGALHDGGFYGVRLDGAVDRGDLQGEFD
ncbi:hypothetical protein JCM5353_000352 [Sporobolomyces roseus]